MYLENNSAFKATCIPHDKGNGIALMLIIFWYHMIHLLVFLVGGGTIITVQLVFFFCSGVSRLFGGQLTQSESPCF